MKKRIITSLVAAGLVFSCVALTGCNKKPKGDTYELAVVTDVGQLNDGGFNQGTWEGVKAFAEANNKTYKYYQPANGADAQKADRIAAMNQAIENGAKVIVTPGFMQGDALAEVVPANPDVKFVFVDGWNIGQANLTAICYHEEESGFFAGYGAVMDGYTKLGGTFGGGGTNAACNRFAYGYVQGIKAAAAAKGATGVEVKISFQHGDGFSASPELQTQITGWYNNGTQVVFSCGGSMLQSVKAAAAEHTGAKIIGVDVDQYNEDKDRVITSAVKGLSESVQLVLGQWLAGEWDAKLADKLSNLGAKEHATGLPTVAEHWKFNTWTVAQYTELFNKVVAGTVTIDANTPADVKANNGAFFTALTDANVTVVYE